MKAEVRTNVWRAESVSNSYYHKLALKHWKLEIRILWSPFPSLQTKHTHGDTTLPTSPCPLVLGDVWARPRERRLGLFVCTSIHAWMRDKSSISFLSGERIEVWCLDSNIWSVSLGDMEEWGIYPNLELNPVHWKPSTFPCGCQPHVPY